MALNVEKLIAWTKTREIEVSDHSCILYALGVGLGGDPTDPRHLRFLNARDLSALPTMAMVHGVGPDYLFDPEIGVDMVRMLHGESGLEVYGALPTSGKILAEGKIDAVLDRGVDKGAITYFSTRLTSLETGDHLATTSGCFVMRGNGGFGGESGPVPAPHAIPERDPDAVVELETLPQQGLLYQLNGDRNPLHVDPRIARKAGFDRPIFHGLGTFGVAGHGVLRALCDYDPSRLRALKLRYSAPVYPGETIRFEFFDEGGGQHAMRATAVERNKLVLNNGLIEVTE